MPPRAALAPPRRPPWVQHGRGTCLARLESLTARTEGPKNEKISCAGRTRVRCAAPGPRERSRHPVRRVSLGQRAARDRARGPQGADRRGHDLVPRRLQERDAGQNRVRAPVRAPDVQRQRALRRRVLPAARGSRRNEHERHDELRPHELLRDGADERARPRAVDGIGPHGTSARRDRPEEARRAARRRAERETRGRQPAVRQGLRRRSSRTYFRPAIRTRGKRSARWRI